MKENLKLVVVFLFLLIFLTLFAFFVEDNTDNYIRIKCNDSFYFTDKYDTIPNGIRFYDLDKKLDVEIHGTYVIMYPDK